MGLKHPRDLPAENVIVFDGYCILCSRLFRWVLDRDRAQHFQFATAQSPYGQQIYRSLDLSPDDMETMVVLSNGQAFLRLDAVAAISARLRGPMSLLQFVRYLPGWFKDPAYGLVARNRYRLFGRRSQCLLPDGTMRARFVKQGFGSS